MSQFIARLGDSSSHGGAVVEAAVKWTCKGARIARRGDAFACPLHGLQSIAGGSSKYTCEGAPIARHGDPVTCGATLIAGQSAWICEG